MMKIYLINSFLNAQFIFTKTNVKSELGNLEMAYPEGFNLESSLCFHSYVEHNIIIINMLYTWA